MKSFLSYVTYIVMRDMKSNQLLHDGVKLSLEMC